MPRANKVLKPVQIVQALRYGPKGLLRTDGILICAPFKTFRSEQQRLHGCETITGRKQFAIGCLAFVESVKSELGSRAIHRAVEQKDRAYGLARVRLTTVISAVKVNR